MEHDTITIGPYAILKRLGSGSFASVYLCEHMKTKLPYAGKLFKLSSAEDGENSRLGWKVIEDEVNILKRLTHRRTIKFEDIVFSPYGILVIMELVHGKSLIDCFPNHGGGFLESFARSIFSQLLESLDYLHRNGIVHRDIKPENVMVEKDGNVKLIDYGLAQYFPDAVGNSENLMINDLNGSPQYYAPELLECDREHKVRGDKTDIWAAGVFLHVLVSRFHPFDGENDQEIFQQIRSKDVSFEHTDFSPELEDLLCMILQKDPGHRASLPDIMMHPWTTGNLAEFPFTAFAGEGGRVTVLIHHSEPLRTSSCKASFPSAERKLDACHASPSCSGRFVSEYTGRPAQLMFPLVDDNSSYSYGSGGYTSETEEHTGIGTRISNAVSDFFAFLVSWFFPSCGLGRAAP